MARPDLPETYTDFVELVALVEYAAPAARAPAPARAGPRARLAALWRRHALLLLLVVLPNLAALTYFGLLAADRYESEARFLVRGAQAQGPSLSALAGAAAAADGAGAGAGAMRSGDDAHPVNAFIESRDAAFLLAERHDLRVYLARPEADALMRYPRTLFGFPLEATDEGLYRAWQRLVRVRYETASGLTTLTVQAFRPEDARAIAAAVLEGAEALVNRLNARARADAVTSAEAEVGLSRERLDAALARMTAFRTREALVDPVRLSGAVLEIVGRLSYELAQTRAQVAQVEGGSPQSVQLPGLRARAAALEAEIARERGRLAGAEGALAPQLAEYERLVLERELADRGLASSLRLLDAARLGAQRQQLYLERVVEPRAPDWARYPYRLTWIALSAGLSVALYWTVRVVGGNALARARH